MKSRNYTIFNIGWEYPPHIAGGLGIACQGMTRALGSRGHSIQFLLPRLYGDETVDEGIELLDLTSRLHTFEFQEQESVERMLARKLNQPLPIPHQFTYRSDLYAQSVRRHRRGRRGRRGSQIEEMEREKALLLEGGYGVSLHREIHDYARIAGWVAQKIRFDLIHSHDWMTYPAGIAAARATGRPLICHVHATEFDRCGDNINQIVYDLERRAFHECTRVLTVSDYTRNLLIHRYGVEPSKITTVHNGIDAANDLNVDPPSANEKRPIRSKIVLFLGRLTYQKGPEYFVRAAREVIKEVRDVCFVMAGNGDMYERVIEQAAELDIGDYFHFTGQLNREEVQRLYAMSDLYIMPSVSEPFGIAPLEALANGVPVIISRQSGVSEVLPGCPTIDFWDVNKLSQSIVTLLKNKKLAARQRRRGQKHLRNISWETTAMKLEEVYAGMVA